MDAWANRILDALPESAALLDGEGRIVAVNEAWRRFASIILGGAPEERELGASYLEVCDRAGSAGVAEARDAAVGLRAVLGGKSRRFELVYRCSRAAAEEVVQWFKLRVTPVSTGGGGDGGGGALVVHLDVTSERRTEEARAQAAARTARIQQDLEAAQSIARLG